MDIRPWGNYKVLQDEKGFKVKIIEVVPGHRLSLQKHNHRTENWVIVQGDGKVTLGDDIILVSVGDHIFVPKNMPHRIENTGKIPLRFVEAQIGDYLEEDDEERLEDDYGRAGYPDKNN